MSLDDPNMFNETEPVICDEDTHPILRLSFISFGTIIAFVGCLSNLLLIYIFVCKHSKRSNAFQTLLAFFDFMLCLLFITCFGLLSISTTLRISSLYTFLKKFSVHQIIMSRIVQLSIPYVLIANTADKLTWINVDDNQNNTVGGKRLAVICIIVTVIIIVRLPGYFVMEVIDLPGCDFFASKALSSVEIGPFYSNMYQTFDVIVSFFHLFVSFIILCVLNCVVVQKLRTSHKRARKQSACPNTLLTTRTLIEDEERREHKRLRCAIKTTIVIISSYLACNSVNFVLYSIEMFNSKLTQDNETGNFNIFYVIASDLGTNLFVLSSSIRMFIFYMYNPDIRAQIRSVSALNFIFGTPPEKKITSDMLIGVSI